MCGGTAWYSTVQMGKGGGQEANGKESWKKVYTCSSLQRKVSEQFSKAVDNGQ